MSEEKPSEEKPPIDTEAANEQLTEDIEAAVNDNRSEGTNPSIKDTSKSEGSCEWTEEEKKAFLAKLKPYKPPLSSIQQGPVVVTEVTSHDQTVTFKEYPNKSKAVEKTGVDDPTTASSNETATNNNEVSKNKDTTGEEESISISDSHECSDKTAESKDEIVTRGEADKEIGTAELKGSDSNKCSEGPSADDRHSIVQHDNAAAANDVTKSISA